MNSKLAVALHIIVVIAMPFLLGFGMIQAVIAWDYPSWEYNRIPPDTYGFTLEERLELAHITLDYIRRPESAEEAIFLLEEMTLPGTNDPVYNEREIGHMIDVKNATDVIRLLTTAASMLVITGTLILWLVPEHRQRAYRAIYHGGIATVAILLSIAILIGAAWEFFFVAFHELLFPPGTWTFAYSDSLIRLFPEQFWFDVGVIISVGALLLGAIVAAIGYVLSRRAMKNAWAAE